MIDHLRGWPFWTVVAILTVAVSFSFGLEPGLTASQLAINLYILPTVLNSEAAVPRTQSVPFVVFLTGISFAYVELGLWVAAASGLVGAILWAVVALLRPVPTPEAKDLSSGRPIIRI